MQIMGGESYMTENEIERDLPRLAASTSSSKAPTK